MFGSFLSSIGMGSDTKVKDAKAKAKRKAKERKKTEDEPERQRADSQGMSTQDRAAQAAHEQGQADHYKVLAELQQAKTERDHLASEVAHLQHDYDLAEHALQWLQQRDG